MVSHTGTFREEENKADTEKQLKAQNQSVEKATLGDLDELQELKRKMEEGK